MVEPEDCRRPPASESPTELLNVLANIQRMGPLYFWHGLSPEPALTPGGLRGVGVADLNGRRTRVVQVGLPEASLSGLRRRSRNPLRAVGLVLMRAVLTKASAAREYQFEGCRVSVRDHGGDPWSDISDPAASAEGPRLVNDPGWVLDLLRAPERALREIAKDPARGGGWCYRLRLDFHELSYLLPRAERDQVAGRHEAVAAINVLMSAEGQPARVALLPPRDEINPLWLVVELQEYGVSFDDKDLWAEWRVVRGNKRQPTA